MAKKGALAEKAAELEAAVAGLFTGTPAAPVPIPWADISFDSDLEMAKSFIQPDMPPTITAFRKWHLGVFFFFAGKQKEALDLLRDASGLREAYKDDLPMFEKPSGPY